MNYTYKKKYFFFSSKQKDHNNFFVKVMFCSNDLLCIFPVIILDTIACIVGRLTIAYNSIKILFETIILINLFWNVRKDF